MRKYKLFSAVLSLFLLVPASITWAQTVTSQKGLTTIVFNVPQGAIKVYLPEDIRAGDMISGSIKLEPAGTTANQRQRAMADLLRRELKIGDPNDPNQVAQSLLKRYHEGPTDRFFNTEAKSLPYLSSVILLNKGEAEFSIPLHINSPDPSFSSTPSSCSWPSHVLNASPLRINGAFDGNAENTRCRISGREEEILAESPRNCFVQMPSNTTGSKSMEVTETNAAVCSGTVNVVDMQVTAGRLNLKKGENTYVDVSITGLQQLKESATLTVNNNTTGVVVMLPANTVVTLLHPDSVADGVFHQHYPVHSLVAGNFSVTVDLALPDNPPLVFADVHIQEVKGLKNGMSDAFGKVVIEATGTQASKHPELDGCGTCLSCIQARLNEDKVALVGWLGETLIAHFAGAALDAAGGVAKWLKDRYENIKTAQDAADAVNNALNNKEIQVVELDEKQCDKNGACLVKGIAFYDTKTSCIDVFLKCIASKACCSHTVTNFHLKYCVGDKGFILPKQTPSWEVVVE